MLLFPTARPAPGSILCARLLIMHFNAVFTLLHYDSISRTACSGLNFFLPVGVLDFFGVFVVVASNQYSGAILAAIQTE